jgi:putative cofactor-binding repeat protein
VRDVNAPSNSTDTASYGIYLDDGASNATVTGNVILGKMVSCFTLHGGKNNLFEDNICDTGNARTQYIMRQSASTACGSGATCGNMSNNNFHSNIITLGSSGSGGGYHADSANTPMNISTNFYHNYVGTSVNTSTNNPAGGSETNAIFGDPQITCWSPTIVGSSPVFNSPVSFAGITGGWGLPDFTIPQTGTAPSWPHSC